MLAAVLFFLVLLVVSPAEAQSPEGAIKAAQDAGVAIVAFISFALGTRYLYLLVKAVIDDKTADRSAAQAWFSEVASRYGTLAVEMQTTRAQEAKDAESDRLAMGTLEKAVTQGKTSADSLAGDVRTLMKRIEPAIAAMEAIEKDIKRRDAKEAEQDAETSKLAQTIEGFTAEFTKLKEQIEKGTFHDHKTLRATGAGSAVDPHVRTPSTGAGDVAAADQHPAASLV